MRRVVPALLIAARILAILAVLAGLAAGLLVNALVAFICFDSCPPAKVYFSNSGSGAMSPLAPCIALATLALFLVYCLATRQPRRAVIVVLFFLLGGVIGVAALNALVQHAQTTLPVSEDGLLVEGPVTAWARQFALALLLALVVWSGGLACLEWGRRWERPSQRATA